MQTCTKQVLKTIDDLSRIYYNGPESYNIPPDQFCRKSYEMCAVELIKVYIVQNESRIPAIFAVEKLRKKTEQHALNFQAGDSRKLIFLTISDVATNILDHLL